MRSTNGTTAQKSLFTGSASELTRALSEPFEPSEVRFKPAAVNGNRALALAYVDARAIQDRLDAVLGVDGWQDDYECLADGSVICRLRLRMGEEWITKVDVGGPSEQPDGGDRLKAAFSDALKRAAVKFGIGRYLYRLPNQWLDYDTKRREFTSAPSLPIWAQPARRKTGHKSAAAASEPRTGSGKMAGHALPANGAELQRRLYDYDARLGAEGRCGPGELVKHVVEAGVRAGYDSDLAAWSGPAIRLAVEETKTFEAQLVPANRSAQKEVA
jgi:hypothetical protein